LLQSPWHAFQPPLLPNVVAGMGVAAGMAGAGMAVAGMVGAGMAAATGTAVGTATGMGATGMVDGAGGLGLPVGRPLLAPR